MTRLGVALLAPLLFVPLLLAPFVLGAGPRFDLPGMLTVRVTVDGKDATGRCRLFAYPEKQRGQLALDGVAAEPLRLAAGRYRIRLECPGSAGSLTSTLARVPIQGGKTTRRSVSLRSGAVVVHTVRDGGQVFAEVKVIDPALGDVLAEGLSGNRLSVPTGRYEVRVGYSEGMRFPCHATRTVKIGGGRPARVRIDLSDGLMRFDVSRNRRPAAGHVALFSPGTATRLLEFPAGRTELVPPGRYDVEVTLESSYDFEGRRLRNLEVRPGKTTRDAVAFTVGSLRVGARLHGQKVGGRVYLSLPRAPDYFNFADLGQTIDLSPGPYRVRAVLDDDVPYNAARPKELGVERVVKVKARQRQEVTLDFTPGVVRVNATKNGKRATAAVSVWLREPRVKLTGATAGQQLAVAAGTYDIEVLYPNGRGGDLLKLRGVQVESGQETRRRVNIERGSLTIDTFDRGSRVDAEVRFFKRSSKAPFVIARGGETVELPPAIYEIEIVHGEKSRMVSAMRVKPGSWDVRKVEF